MSTKFANEWVYGPDYPNRTSPNGLAYPQEEGSYLDEVTLAYKLHPSTIEGKVRAIRTLSDRNVIEIEAEDIRKDRNGAVKARVKVSMNGIPLAYDRMDVDRHEERVRIANSAHGKLDKIRQEMYSKVLIKHDIDRFCEAVWPTYVGGQTSQWVTPAKQLPQFLLKPYVLPNAGTIIFGPPGTGKSYLALLMAISMNAGLDKLWPIEAAHPTLFINLERSPDSISNRIACCNTLLGLDEDWPLLVLNARGKSLMDLHEVVKSDIKKYGIEVIILDSISRAGAGGMGKDDVANLITDALNNFGTAWIAIGHSPREDNSHVFGSQMFDAAADIVVKTVGERKDGPITMMMEVVKDNDIGYQPKEYVTYEFNEYGLADFRQATADEAAIIQVKQGSNLEQIMCYLKDNGASSAEQVAEATGIKPNTITQAFRRHDDIFVKVAESGKHTLYGLLARETDM